MPKKSSAARAGAQRNKPKAQKSFELVRPGVGTLETPEIAETQEISEEQKPELQAATESPQESIATETQTQRAKTTKVARRVAVAPSPLQKEERKAEEVREEENTERPVSTIHKGSAAARLAARRQAAQRTQRNAATLITTEHFAYVRRDLITIAILATIMFTAIIILYFTLGRA